MARYRFSIDIGAFIGARYINFTEGDGKPQIPGVFIPAAVNGIEVKQDARDESKANRSKFRAFLNFQQRVCNFKFIDSIKQKLMRQGDTPTLYNVPAYDVCYTLPEAKRTVIRKALVKRLLAEHPEWAGQKDEKGTDLSRAVSTLMPFNIGESYLMEEQSAAQTASASVSAPISQPTAGYTPAAPAPADSEWQPTDENGDDLPF